MLERVALHQSRFRTPGVSQDARGVLVGQRGLVLFGSIDRFVAFLRGYADEASLDELVPGIAIQHVVTPLRTREIAFSFVAESSYRMDRVAQVAQLTGGLTFTGTSRHYVQYRDADAPLGYDVIELPPSDAPIHLHHSDFHQTYEVDAELSLRGLLLRLRPQPTRPGAARRSSEEGPLLVTTAPGLAPALVSYLVRNGVPGRVGRILWEATSSFSEAGAEAHLFDLPSPPARLVRLLRSVPGVVVYRQIIPGVAVEVGHAHPVSLASCASLFDDGGLVLLHGGSPPREVSEMPTMVGVGALLGTRDVILEPMERTPARARAADAAAPQSGDPIPLRLAPASGSPRRVTAVVVPRRQRAWLARVLYALPPRALAGLRMALSPERIFLYDAGGIEGIPLGRAYAEPASRIHVPVGLTLVPAVAPDVLTALVPDQQRGHVFFEPGGGPPRFVETNAFGPIGRTAIAEVTGQTVPAHPPSNADVPLTLLHYEPARTLPLWGAVGDDDDESPADRDDADGSDKPSGGGAGPGDDGPGRAVVLPETAGEAR